MTSYDSNAFDLNLGGQDVPGGAVFNGQELVYAQPIGGSLSLIVCTPPSGKSAFRSQR